MIEVWDALFRIANLHTFDLMKHIYMKMNHIKEIYFKKVVQQHLIFKRLNIADILKKC